MVRVSHKVIHKKDAKNLKDDDDYKTGDPWDTFLLTEVGDYYYAVAVGNIPNFFGIKFQKETEGVVGSIYEWCDSYAEARHFLKEHIHNQKQDKTPESGEVALAAMHTKTSGSC
jgi:hypothetical protein